MVIKSNNEEYMVMIDRFHIKTRGISLRADEAALLGIRRVYNSCSDVDYMSTDDIQVWSEGLYRKDRGEAIMVESSLKFIEGVPLYVSSCIVFHTFEQCNLFYLRHQEDYGIAGGFMHLFN